MAISLSFLVISLVAGCGKKPDGAAASVGELSSEGKLPPIGQASDAPQFVRNLSLLYPQAEIYRVEERIIQKTNHALADIAAYYEKTLLKHGFKEATRLEQTGGALLQYERTTSGKIGELVSVDITKLPYADNYIIRIGRSEVDYNKGKP